MVTPINPKFKELPIDIQLKIERLALDQLRRADVETGDLTLPEPVSRSQNSELVSAFMGMDIEEQRKVLISEDVDFRQMEIVEQTKVLNSLKEDTINIASLFDSGSIPKDSPEYTTAQNIYLNVKPFIEPAAEMGGITAGAIGGAPLGPLGSIAGAGLGFGLVRQTFDIVETLLGLQEPKGVVGELAESGIDVTMGAAFETGGQIAAPILRGAGGLIKRQIGKLGEKTVLTEAGGRKKALERFIEESKGTALTQPQITKNIKIGRELETKIRKIDSEFRFTQGQLTNDASAISLERTLARKAGQDLSQEQRAHAVEVLRQYYNKKVLSTGTVEDFITYTERMSKELEASTKQAAKAVESEVLRLSSHLEPQVIGTNIYKNLSAGKDVLRRKASVLYDKIPNINLETTKLSSDIKGFVRSEDKIIEPRTRQMIALINSKILKKVPGKAITTTNPATGEITTTEPTKVIPIGYQVLRKLHSRVGKAYSASNSGATPNLEDARQLFAIRNMLDDAMRQMENVSPQAATAYKKATRFYKEEFIPTFRQGTVANVLQKGVRGEETRIAKANIAQAFDSLDGIDDLIRATNSAQVAKSMMKDYYSFSLINKAVNSEGKVVANKASAWLSSNGGKLKKLGLVDEFKGLENLQRQVDGLIKNRDVFNKSVAGRILEADVDTMINNAFRGSKNIAKTTKELLALTKGNKEATEGLKKAFAENLMRQSENIQPSFFQIGGEVDAEIEFLKSTAKLTKQFRKFLPAIKIMYAGQPAKQEAISDVWRAYQTLERTAKSPIGGGSDTFELFGKTLDIVAGSTAPGKWYAFKTVRDMVNRFGERNVEKYLRRAMFDPDYAQVLVEISKAGKTSPVIPRGKVSALERLMTIVGFETRNLGVLPERKKGAPIERIPALL